ncbi:MAG: PLP-dependent aspartate aminotransferase family protein [Candidatus Eisenbacteria bacterium]|nr:aminotransferase class I/II-fold pyridoxal phosphate-dependent enzyme [Candidatus Eisenbacteria bacterium]
MDDPAGRGRTGFRTRAIHGSRASIARGELGKPVALPLVQTSTFSFDSPEEMFEVFGDESRGYVYSRYRNPTVETAEEKIAAIENADFSLLFASGLAAIHAVLWTMVPSGGRVLVASDLYGGSADLMSRLLPRLGIEREIVDLGDGEALARGLDRRPSLLFFETPTNPLLRVFDGPAICTRAKDAGVRVAVDGTFATPALQNPLDWGADAVVHSATKYLGGHSDLVLGAVVGRGSLRDPLEKARRSLGAVADPFAAWLLHRGLATLALRVRAASDSALRIARALTSDPLVRRVRYPGLESDAGHAIAARQMRAFGGILSFDLAGGRDAAVRLMGGLRVIRLATSLGGVETLLSHPATSSHRMLRPEERERAGIGEGLLRLAVGLEETEDLLGDLEQAMAGISAER